MLVSLYMKLSHLSHMRKYIYINFLHHTALQLEDNVFNQIQDFVTVSCKKTRSSHLHLKDRVKRLINLRFGQ